MRLPIVQYAAWSRDQSVRENSTSGGVFTEFAKVVFKKGGIVVAAGWKINPLRVVHKVVQSEDDLCDIRGAKYVPSDMSEAWAAVENAIRADRLCFFVGTPCQTAAIRKRFGDGNGNLILCALFCHSVPELSVWQKYAMELESTKGRSLKSVQFRSKKHGGSWHRGMFVAEFGDGVAPIIEPLAGNVYGDAFFMRLSTRTSCLNCRFKSGNSCADFMIGDFWGVEEFYPELDYQKGVNALLVYSDTGCSLLKESNCKYREVSYSEIVAHNRHLENCVKCSIKSRDRFLRLCKTMSLRKALYTIRHRPVWKRALSRFCRIFSEGV